MAKIKTVKAREILDSRGHPTVETFIGLSDGSSGVASVPSGASRGKYEALELRDNDPKRFKGKGVLKAVTNVNQTIASKIIGMEADEQNKLDQTLIDLDGTINKTNLGANAILSVSQGVVEAAAASHQLPIYRYLFAKYQMASVKTKMASPTFNVINGGAHGAGNLDFQEFHVIPTLRFSYAQALKAGEEIYQALKQALAYRGAIHSVGDEGGFAPNLFTNLDALEVMMEAIKQTDYVFGQDVFLGLDVAADWFFKNGRYTIKDHSQSMSPQDLIEYYQRLNEQYHLFSLEDPLHEDDWKGWAELTTLLGKSTLVIGDDLLSTNKDRVKKAIEAKACSAILVKPNQIGTISETVTVIKLARAAGWKIIVSHRSGETNDDFIADFAIGLGAEYTKFGAPARGERVAKYNRLLAIEDELTKLNK
ncbi:phosphopyruvate hydratase [Patescibacteria group bacterium]|nr:phosphopyruvate hydratase [Patescibacteria group bacterium]MBU1931890.1 phosphopyruvate hydratase [Patescibacteria group bacterium]